MNANKITGKRLIQSVIAKYSHSGKVDYDCDRRDSYRKNWKKCARVFKRRANRKLDKLMEEETV